MYKKLEFEMSDGLIIKGQIEGNIDSDNLIVMLHSGGYDRHERGIKEIKNQQKIYFNPLGNYDYLTNLLKHDYAILRIDQRNHGESGKNIDIDPLIKTLNSLDIPSKDINIIIKAELARDKQTLNKLINKYPKIKDIVNRPPIQDLSFIKMKDDLEEVMKKLPKKIKKEFHTIDYVGTCMGTVVLGLYLKENKEKANSLTLFSPLYTFEYSFINPPKEAEFLINKKNAVENGKQFRLGNAVEGPSTLKEVKEFSKNFLTNIASLDIPIFCIQGQNDVLVPQKMQTQIFKQLENYRIANNLSEIYYAENKGVHCLYDAIFPSVLDAYWFIESNKKPVKTKTKPL